MKRRVMAILLLLALGCLCACGSVRQDQQTSREDEAETQLDQSGGDETVPEQAKQEEDDEVDTENRSLLAKALGVEETDRSMRFLLNALKTVGAGRIQSAEAREENGQKLLAILAEDGTEFWIYLTNSGGVDAVKNLTTGEWPIRSSR